MPRANARTTTRRDHRRDYPVAFFGDSLMWGQGLAREHRFAELTADALAGDAGKEMLVVYDWSRSGAQINATREDRRQFTLTFPELFKTSAKAAAFVDGDEQTAHALFGEIPATFPTVTWQVEHLPPERGRSVKLALVCGGGNDMGLETLFDPDTFDSDFVTQWEGRIQKIAFEYVYALLEQVRKRCPNAVILYYGYHSPFSHESSHAKMRAFAKYLNDNDLTWALNEWLHIRPVNSVLHEIRCRSVWAVGRALYWQKQAITRINQDSDLRGPGVLFVPSGFEPKNSTFGPEPFVWQDYADPADDEMRADRVGEIPRKDQRQHLQTCAMAGILKQGMGAGARPPIGLQELVDAEKGLTGPLPLLDLLRRLIGLMQGGATDDLINQGRRELAGAAGDEFDRISRAAIASFLHPNVAGAKRFADMALRRFGDERNRVAQLAAEQAPRGPGGVVAGSGQAETTDATLRRYGLRGRSPRVEADLGQLDVDSLGIWAVTARDSDKDMATDVYLVVDTKEAGLRRQRRYRLNMPWGVLVVPGIPRVVVKKQYPEFEPAMSTRMTVDPGAHLLLRDVKRIWLELGPDRNAEVLQNVLPPRPEPAGSVWRPRRLFLLVNGVQVTDQTFRNLELKPGDSHSFAYPPRRGPVFHAAGNG